MGAAATGTQPCKDRNRNLQPSMSACLDRHGSFCPSRDRRVYLSIHPLLCMQSPQTAAEEVRRRALYARALRLPSGVEPQPQRKEGMCFECEVCGEVSCGHAKADGSHT